MSAPSLDRAGDLWYNSTEKGGGGMFLTKKGFAKILIMAICYIALGSICVALGVAFSLAGADATLLLMLGVIVFLLCVLIVLWGLYAEGKGKLLNSARKLVRIDLHPGDFIKEYESLKDSQELIIKKPSFEVLQMLAVAYDSLDEREKCLATVEEMIAVAPVKKRTQAELFRVSILFSYGKKEEAELIFIKLQEQKLDAVSKLMVDSILKSDRAKAMGDYKTVELYNLNLLERSFPKLDNLGSLIVNYTLGEVYEKLGESEKSLARYEYCAANGGETAIKTAAKKAIDSLKKNEATDL